MSGIIRAIQGLALLTLMGLAVPCAASPSEDGFAAFLERKYGRAGGLFGMLDKVLPPDKSMSSPVPLEGRKSDGSYWWSAYFGPGNVSVFGWAHRALSQRCTMEGGHLVSVAPFAILAGPSGVSAMMQDPGGAGGFGITPQMMRDWNHAAHPDERVVVEPWRQTATSRNAALVDARHVLGVFTCADGGNHPLWHVSILPTQLGQWDEFASNDSVGTHWVMLRIQAVTRAMMDRINAVETTRTEADRQTRLTENDLATERHREWGARERTDRPRIAAFQKSIKIGDGTNCGLVLSLNGPLAEVQVPTDITLSSGASRVFVKRAALAPPGSRFDCYVMGMMTANVIDTSPVQ